MGWELQVDVVNGNSRCARNGNGFLGFARSRFLGFARNDRLTY